MGKITLELVREKSEGTLFQPIARKAETLQELLETTEPERLADFCINILEERWPEAEPYIDKDREFKTWYGWYFPPRNLKYWVHKVVPYLIISTLFTTLIGIPLIGCFREANCPDYEGFQARYSFLQGCSYLKKQEYIPLDQMVRAEDT